MSQVYGGGGNSGTTYKNDFIELFNRGASAQSLGGWSVQYASSNGTSWLVTALTNVTLQPGQYYLVQEAAGAGGTTNLPTPDATGSIAMSTTAGKVALVNTTAALSGSCPAAGVVDLIGFGSGANCFETAAAPAPSNNTTALIRAANGCTDANNNSTDFTTGPPN
ncbi:MAG: lamin tail domain-containing protein, partial [Acidobacteriota bacterium]|nr:lamin tail domain-containing protein [Acidobacteriota bacterium]